MDREILIEGYKRVLTTLYDPTLKNYFERCLTMLKHLKHTEHSVRSVGKTEVMAIAKSIKRQLFSRQGPDYFRFLVKVLRPTKAVKGVTPRCSAGAELLYEQAIGRSVPVSTAAEEMVKHSKTLSGCQHWLVNEIAIMSDKLGLCAWEVIQAAATKPCGFVHFFPGL